MEINSEEKLIEFIKDKPLPEVIKYFNDNKINYKQITNFKKTLLYLIKNEASFEVIKYIVENQREFPKNKENINILFCAIEHGNFEVAKLFLRKRVKITDKNENSKNIIEYLLNKEKLNVDNFLFILNINKDTSLIASEALCFLIQKFNISNFSYIKILKIIFQYKFYDVQFIKNVLFLRKKRNGISDKEFKKLIVYGNNSIIKLNEKNVNNNYPLLLAVINNDIELTQLLISYAKKNNFILEINEKNSNNDYPLLSAIQNNNIELVDLLIGYAKENNIILEINRTNELGYYPLLSAIKNNNIKLVHLLINYTKENKIILE